MTLIIYQDNKLYADKRVTATLKDGEETFHDNAVKIRLITPTEKNNGVFAVTGVGCSDVIDGVADLLESGPPGVINNIMAFRYILTALKIRTKQVDLGAVLLLRENGSVYFINFMVDDDPSAVVEKIETEDRVFICGDKYERASTLIDLGVPVDQVFAYMSKITPYVSASYDTLEIKRTKDSTCTAGDIETTIQKPSDIGDIEHVVDRIRKGIHDDVVVENSPKKKRTKKK